MGYGGAIASRYLGIPLVLEDNGDQLSDLEAKGIAPQGLQRRISIYLTDLLVRQASHIVSSGDGWRKQFIRRWNVADEKVTVVENGTIVTNLLERETLRCFRHLTAINQIPALVYLGGFYPWHGVTVLLRAFAKALELRNPMRLVLIGSGYAKEEAQTLASDLDLGDAVTFAGHLSPVDFSKILGNADIGLSPYCGWIEYSGLKIFDYKAAGLASIASGEEGMPATLVHNETGLIVPPCDEGALTRAILELSNNLDRTWEMGRAARIEAEQLHQWRQTAENLEIIFTSFAIKSDIYD